MKLGLTGQYRTCTHTHTGAPLSVCSVRPIEAHTHTHTHTPTHPNCAPSADLYMCFSFVWAGRCKVCVCVCRELALTPAIHISCFSNPYPPSRVALSGFLYWHSHSNQSPGHSSALTAKNTYCAGLYCSTFQVRSWAPLPLFLQRLRVMVMAVPCMCMCGVKPTKWTGSRGVATLPCRSAYTHTYTHMYTQTHRFLCDAFPGCVCVCVKTKACTAAHTHTHHARTQTHTYTAPCTIHAQHWQRMEDKLQGSAASNVYVCVCVCACVKALYSLLARRKCTSYRMCTGLSRQMSKQVRATS